MPLRPLLAQFPLPARQWGQPELFSEKVNVGGYKIHACGVSVQHRVHSTEVFASAAELNPENALRRAFFELLERLTVTTACTQKRFAHLFPPTSRAEANTYSKSNGVALHSSQNLAKRSAMLELVERDGVLRSWYGEVAPRPLAFAPSAEEKLLEEFYELSAFQLDRKSSGPSVVGFFGFPRREEAHPLFFGFGASDHLPAALEKAKSEAHQRLAFLWGEKISRRSPRFAPTPAYHQDLYLVPRHKAKLVNWLQGKHLRPESAFLISPANSREKIEYFNLTPRWLEGRLHVFKARSASRIPLWFGLPLLEILRSPPRAIAIHPIA